MINVTPINDSKEHTPDSTCECNPTVEIHEEILVIHNAFDGREASEAEEEQAQ